MAKKREVYFLKKGGYLLVGEWLENVGYFIMKVLFTFR